MYSFTISLDLLPDNYWNDHFNGTFDFRLFGHCVTQQPLVDHTERALTHFTDENDIISGHFPFFADIF